jgi:hypothetical protein
MQRVNRVGGARSVDVYGAQGESTLIGDGDSYHLAPIDAVCNGGRVAVCRRSDGNKEHDVEIESTGCCPRHEQMSVVDRIEGAAEDADSPSNRADSHESPQPWTNVRDLERK